MRRRGGIGTAAAAAALALALPAAAAAVDPAIAMQQAIEKTLQTQLDVKAPGMKVTTVACTLGKDGRRGTCKASFVYRAVTGFYLLEVVQPANGKPSFTSTSVTCFARKSGKKIPCNG